MRAMSLRETAKSKSHRRTHRVEPDGTGRESMHLTRGDLGREGERGVSRGHGSAKKAVKAVGANNRTLAHHGFTLPWPVATASGAAR